MPPQSCHSFLDYRSVDIYFVFSFVFDFLEPYEELVERLEGLGWTQGTPEDRQGRPPFLVIKRKPNGDREKYTSNSLFKCLLPNTRVELLYQELDAKKDWRWDAAFDVSVEAVARLFDNGAGSITFKVSCDDDIDFVKVYQLLSLSQRQYKKDRILSRIRFPDEKQPDELYRLFVRLLRESISAINTYEKHYVALQDEEIMDLNDRETHAQNPYVLSLVELNISNEKTPFFHQAALDDFRYKELASILFRLIFPHGFSENVREHISNTRIPYGLLNEAGHLRNFAWDNRVLMCFSQTSSLLGCLEKNETPALVIRRSMLDIIEILRTRWHMSVLINAQLDQDLESFRLERSGDNIDVLGRLIKRRRRFASFLHDPLPYSFEGGSVSRLSAVATEEMALPSLRQMTFEKLNTLDRLHADQMKYLKLKDFDSYIDSMRSKKESEY